MSLDSGYIYSGATSWPRPRYPGNYVNPDEVASEQGVYAGLGIAWILTQIRARSKLFQNKPVRSIQRFAKLLNDASMKSANPPPCRFDTFFSVRPIAGILSWGHDGCWAHNRLFLKCLKKVRPDLKTVYEFHVFQDGIDLSKVRELQWNEQFNFLRLFRYLWHVSSGDLVALEEWTRRPDSNSYSMSYAVFDSTSGDEVVPPDGWQEAAKVNIQQALDGLRP